VYLEVVDFRSGRTVRKVTFQAFPDAFRGAGVEPPRRKKTLLWGLNCPSIEATEKVQIPSIPLISVPSGRFPRASAKPHRRCAPAGSWLSR